MNKEAFGKIDTLIEENAKFILPVLGAAGLGYLGYGIGDDVSNGVRFELGKDLVKQALAEKEAAAEPLSFMNKLVKKRIENPENFESFAHLNKPAAKIGRKVAEFLLDKGIISTDGKDLDELIGMTKTAGKIPAVLGAGLGAGLGYAVGNKIDKIYGKKKPK